MKNLFLALTVAALTLAPAMAFAGGGSKPNSSIKVVNNGTSTLAVFIDAGGNLAAINGIAPGTPTAAVQAQFTAAGGSTIEPGRSNTFTNLQAGTHTVTGEFINQTVPVAPTTGVPTTVTVNLNKGQTKTVTFTGTFAAATATVQ